MNKYKELFEWKFKKTHRNKNMNIFKKIYYNFSMSTYTEKRLFEFIWKIINWSSNYILDVGCGGWHEKLNIYWKVFWVDVSKESLENSKKIYYEVKNIDVIDNKLPYDDNYFDYVYCSEVFGHIYINDKDIFLSEIKRVLKEDWILFMTVETFWDNWLTRFLKRKGFYDKYRINYQGHVWLLSPNDTINFIKKYFNISYFERTSTWFLPIDWYLFLLEVYPILKFLKNDIIRRLLNIILYPIFLLSLKFSKLSESNDVLVLCNK